MNRIFAVAHAAIEEDGGFDGGGGAWSGRCRLCGGRRCCLGLEYGINFAEELAGIDGLGDVAVHSGGDAFFAVSGNCFSGEGDDRHSRRPRRGGFPFANEAAGFEAVHVGHLAVHEYCIETSLGGFLDGESAVSDDFAGTPGAAKEFFGDELVHLVVFSDQEMQFARLLGGDGGGIRAAFPGLDERGDRVQ